MKNFQQKAFDSEDKNLKIQAPSVTKYMTRKLITFKPETEMSEVIASLLKNRITGAPVLNNRGEVVGLIDDKDCLKVLFAGAYYNHPVEKNIVSRYMSNIMKSITVDMDILEVSEIFLQTNFKRLLVMDDSGKLVGQISRRDALKAVQEMEKNTW
jgi:predicted transcriptional regulator